jgi:D-glycero-D-manno-heptose 1,7-bisphosphate phosphatase
VRRAVFLDRDGVVNGSCLIEGIPKPPRRISEVLILEDVTTAVELIKSLDFLPVVVTNQPDVARGRSTRNEVEEINKYIGELTGISHFYTCFHDDSAGCNCRKPAPGLILEASKDLGIDPTESYMVGDRWRDVAAGQEAGCRVFFIDYSYPEKAPKMPFTKVSSLFEATNMILGENVDSKHK